MDPLAKHLERLLERARRAQRAFTARWGQHTNRRSLIILAVVGSIVTLGYLYAIRPPDSFPTGELVTVPQGQTVTQIAQTLHEDGVIRSPLVFKIIVTLLGRQRSLHAGDYLFKEPKDLFVVMHAVATGAYGLEPFRIRIPEGATTDEMALIFGSQLQRFDPQKFIAQARPMEGYLFPDTYFFLPNATETTVIEAMRQNFDTHEASIDPTIKASGRSLSDIVIMASILEREARTMTDKQMIAGVLWRRIKIGMPLQTDVAFLYTLGKAMSLTKQDLATDSPYNTYLHKGLPPTPIGSPSLDSLLAAATPIDKGYLYYLADSSGVTHFSKTFTGQLANEHLYLGK